MKWSILFSMFIGTFLFAWEPSLSSFVKTESFKFWQSQERFGIIHFPNQFISVSEQCVEKVSNSYTVRSCDAWKIYEIISNGTMDKKLYEKDIRHFKTLRELSVALCIQAGGVIDTEQNEYSPMNTDYTLEEFCIFTDGSMATLRSALNYYIQRTKGK